MNIIDNIYILQMQYPNQTQQQNSHIETHQNHQNNEQHPQQHNQQHNEYQNNYEHQNNNYANNQQINIDFVQFNQSNGENVDDQNQVAQGYQNNQQNQQNYDNQQQRYYFHDYNQQNNNNQQANQQNQNLQNYENGQRYYFHNYNDQNNQQGHQQIENQQQTHENNEGQQKNVQTVAQEVQTKQIKQQTQKLQQQLLKIKLLAAELEEQLNRQKQTLAQKQKQNQTERLLHLEKQKEREKEREIQKQKQLLREKQRKQEKKREEQRLKQKQADAKKQKQLQEQVEKEKKKLKQKDQQRQRQRQKQRKQQATKLKQLNKQQKELQKQKQKVEQLEKQNIKKEQILLLKQEQIQKQKKEINQIKQQESIKKQKKKKKKHKDSKPQHEQNPQPTVLKTQQKQIIKQQTVAVNSNPHQTATAIKKQQNPPPNPQPPQPSTNAVVVVPVVPIVAVSQIAQPSQNLIIKQAQRQRIQSTLKLFIQYTGKHRLHINNQKSVLLNLYQQIDRRKSTKYVWYHLIKQYLAQCQNLAKTFHETSYKTNKQQKVQNTNKYLNIGEQLKQATDQLLFLKKQSGNDYNRINDYISSKINIELQVTFNKFISEMNKAQFNLNQKKKACLELEQQFKKKIQKLTKVYNRGREGKQQQEDVFVQTCKFIQFQRQFRYSLINWGKGIIELRKIFILLQTKLNDEIQIVLNSFKNAQAIIYSFHQQKFDKIVSSRDQILRQDRFCKLCALADNDYIKYAVEVAQKISLSEVEDRYFQYFIQMPHFEILTGKSQDLLKGMVNKSFQLKNVNEQLINTISGNLVQFNRQTSQYLNKFIIKNLSATIVAEGVIQFDELLPGIIFNDNRTIRIGFKDQDRAEQLICLLNQKTQP